jgi:hypothetical protein
VNRDDGLRLSKKRRAKTAPSEGEKKSLASGIGRPNGLHTTCIGGAGGFACEPGFFHSF